MGSLCVIDVFSKYVSIKALKDKKAKTVLKEKKFIIVLCKSG